MVNLKEEQRMPYWFWGVEQRMPYWEVGSGGENIINTSGLSLLLRDREEIY